MTRIENGNQAGELLRFEQVALGYGQRRVLCDLNFSIHSGDYVAIVGSNGSGKSTLLKAMLGIVRPQSGRVVTVAPGHGARLHFGYVPQLQTVDEIFPLTAFEVVLMGRYGRVGALRRPGPVDHERVRVALADVGIEDLTDRLYRELSGGQKQRVLIARALANDPDLLVLDEPANDLDIAAEKAIMALIDRLHTERRIAVAMVTHSLNAVANYSEKIGVISNQQCQFLPVESLLRTEYLQELYGVALRVIEVDGMRVVV